MPYNPQKDAVVVSKPFGAVGFPIDSRSFFYDEANFVRRAFISIAEVLAYFDTPFKREGMFYVFVNSTGTLQPNGTILGGTRVAYWWKEGTADNQLIVVAAKGDKGDKGDTGEQGVQGIQGIQGIQGDKGDKGDTGEQGVQGIQGPIGFTTTDMTTAGTILGLNEGDTVPSSPKQLSVVGASIVSNVFTINYQNAVSGYVAASGVDTPLTNAMSPVQMFQNLQKQNDNRYTKSEADAKVADNLTASTTVAPSKTAVNTALALKADIASPTFTGTVSGITKTMVGLGSVDNTADTAKNVLTATKLATARNINGVAFDGTANITVADATKEPTANKSIVLTSPDDVKFPTTKAVSDALALKADIASPTFTGTVSGITKTMVGLGSVDNTADTAKNVLTATKLATARNINGVAFDGTANITVADATKEPTANKSIVLTSPDDVKFPTTKAVSDALALKADIASPTFTGTPSLPTGTTGVTQTVGDNSTKLATTAYVKTAVDAIGGVTLLKGSTTVNHTDVTINRYKDITVTGAVVGDVVNIDNQFRLLGPYWPFWISAKVTAANTVRIYFSNLQLYFDAGTTDASSILNVFTGKPIESIPWTINYTIIK